jgi:hypothetical protein
MPAMIEYRGLPALAYAAQTGAQLMRRRREGELAQPIDGAVAHALWKYGAAQQIVCIAIDHRALAKAQPYPGWAYLLLLLPRKLRHLSRDGGRLLGTFGNQLAFFVRMSRLTLVARGGARFERLSRMMSRREPISA